GQLFYGVRRAVGYDGNARNIRVVGRGHSQALDTKPPRGQQPYYAGQFAITAVYQERKSMSHPSTISFKPAPAGTIGYTFSSSETRMSITTVPGVAIPRSSTLVN